MITEQQGQQQFEAADQIEAAVQQGRWKGIVPDKLWLIECEQGITLEIELDRFMRGLILEGQPDMTPDGQYRLRLLTRGKPCGEKKRIVELLPQYQMHTDPDIVGECLVENHQIAAVVFDTLNALWAIKQPK